MIKQLIGKIKFANGMAAPGVEVRVFDQDAPGKGDDDLTITPGLTGPDGSFKLRYDPGRYLDFAKLPVLGLKVPDVLDILAPYLHLRYTTGDGAARTHSVPLAPFQDQYFLPESAPVDFLPSRDGFVFHNYFPPIRLPFTLPGFPDAGRITGGYGLCGGMSAAASDFYLTRRPLPQRTEAPPVRSKLYRYLFRRAMDSFKMGESVLRFAQWMSLEDSGANSTGQLTLTELEKLRAALAEQRLAPLGLVISAGRDLRAIAQDVWKNHQVLAYGWRDNADGSVDVRVYDPNSPARDDVYIRVEHTPDGAKCQPVNLRIQPMQIRGFFLMPYDPADPPKGL